MLMFQFIRVPGPSYFLFTIKHFSGLVTRCEIGSIPPLVIKMDKIRWVSVVK